VEFLQTQCICNLAWFEKWMEIVRERGLHEKVAEIAKAAGLLPRPISNT